MKISKYSLYLNLVWVALLGFGMTGIILDKPLGFIIFFMVCLMHSGKNILSEGLESLHLLLIYKDLEKKDKNQDL